MNETENQNCGILLYQYLEGKKVSLNAHLEKRLKSTDFVQLRKLTNNRVTPPKKLEGKNYKEEIIMENRNNQKRTSTSSHPHVHPPTSIWALCTAFSPVTRDELSTFLSKAKLSSACSPDPNPFKYSRTLLQKFLLFPSPTSSLFSS